jgi:phosphoheptose isomerase
MSYAIQHLKETAEIVAKLDPIAIEKGAQELVGVRNRGGRLFILGVGGSAAHALHSHRATYGDADVRRCRFALRNGYSSTRRFSG